MSTLLTTQYLQLYIDPTQDALANGQNVPSAIDYSGNGRTIVAPSNYPVNSTGAINGKSVFVWDGTSKPLTNAATFQLQCGFVVVKINEATFSNYSGILTDAAIWAILVGNGATTYIYDASYPGFEYRLNDGVYLPPYPAPMNAYKIIYFEFPNPITVVGIQFGQDRADTTRKAKMSLALAALYSNSEPFDTPTALRTAMQTIATHFALALTAFNPFTDRNFTNTHREYYLDEGSDKEKITVSRKYQDGGASFNELNITAPQEWTLNYTGLDTAEAALFDAHWEANGISRPFQLLTKLGTLATVYYKAQPARNYNPRNKVQARKVVLIKYPSSSTLYLSDGGDYLVDTGV